MPARADPPEPPPFWGFFPPVVDGTLLALLRTATPGDPERARLGVGGLAEGRFMALETLEHMAMHEDHAVAEATVKGAVTTGQPFGLFLRNFLLGARTGVARDDAWGRPQVMTLASHDDLKLQGLIARHAGGRMPFVAIANRAVDFGPIPRFVFSNADWARAAEVLIAEAAVMVMYFLRATPGVAQEFQLLRTAGAVERTLVVMAPGDPAANELAQAMLALAGTPAATGAPEHGEPPPDFTHRVELQGTDGDEPRLAAAIDALLQRSRTPPPHDLPPLPPRDQPGAHAFQLAQRNAVQQFDEGLAHFERKEGEAAEDALVRSIAFSHWARDPLGRAMAFLQLGHVERFLVKVPNDAVACYRHALDLFDALRVRSPTAATAFEPLAQGFAAYLRELGDERYASYVLSRAATPAPASAPRP